MLARRTNNDLGDANLAGALQRLAQERVSLRAGFLRSEEIRLVKEAWIDITHVDKFADIDHLAGFDLHAFEIFFRQDDVFALLVFVTLDDVLPWNLLAVGFADAF